LFPSRELVGAVLPHVYFEITVVTLVLRDTVSHSRTIKNDASFHFFFYFATRVTQRQTAIQIQATLFFSTCDATIPIIFFFRNSFIYVFPLYDTDLSPTYLIYVKITSTLLDCSPPIFFCCIYIFLKCGDLKKSKQFFFNRLIFHYLLIAVPFQMNID
jgi:hypothetical protein